jgi:hypothetical protein
VVHHSIFVMLLTIVRKLVAHSVLVSFFAITLLFNQFALNFFHNKHDAHESYRTHSERAAFHSHGEHCKVCSLDTLFHLYFEAPSAFHFYRAEETVITISVAAQVAASGDFIRDRAPPFPA